jgi:hypothetical protein
LTTEVSMISISVGSITVAATNHRFIHTFKSEIRISESEVV